MKRRPLASRLAVAALAALAVAVPTSLVAWGGTGHRILGELAMKALPAELPAFLRTPQAAADVGELSREPDRSKASGKVHDHDRDAGHFVDLDDEGKILGGPPMLPLAATRADYETQLRAAGLDQWKAGYLPYAIIDRYQQLTTDLAYWRVLNAAEKNPAWKKNRAWFRQDRIRREALILKGIGELSHFVGDGSQPLHVTTHFNGWGDYPNPKGYSTARLHGPFESELVQQTVKAHAVAAKMAPFKSCGCPIEQRVGAYLTETGRFVIPFYEMEKAGGLAPGDPRGTALATERLAVGASELRDLVVEAWRASANVRIGWRPVAVQDVLSGKVDPYPALYGVD
ncbi:S1/P1 Nuclease [Phenylobacterium sp.]|uniref:S1/P1 Nuclease n=1 Tax=Phenylobacterium sp. TaxID=1871053 RepID=UPI0011F8DE2A|nr:S1/P1 Nuclease [Phenylobacterium sp.]TAL32064.1 MAG: S1/P1 Nuclease [Phenylobacterium sp.]